MIDALSFLAQFSELFVVKKELTASEYILIVDLILKSTSIKVQKNTISNFVPLTPPNPKH